MLRLRVERRSGASPGRRKLILCGAGLLAAATLTGCTFTETKPALGVPTPKTFTYAPPRPAGPLPADWPTLFGSPELTRLAAAVSAGNLDVAAAAARIVQAEADAEVASAPQLPSLSGTGSGQRSWTPPTAFGTVSSVGVTSTAGATGATGTGATGTGATGTTGGTGATSTTGTSTTTTTGVVGLRRREQASNIFQLGLTASYEIDFWGRNAYASEAAERTVLADRFSRDTTILSSVASVVNQYFLILSAQDRIRLAEADAKAAREVLDAIKARLAVGTVTQLEVAQQESALDQELALIPPLQLQADQARTQIALLAGRTPESTRVAGGSLDKLKAPAIPPGLPSQLLARRPDVASAQETLFSAGANVQAARAAFLPSFTLTGNGGLESTVLHTLLTPDALFGSVAGSVTQPIFDGYQLQGQLDQARGVEREDLENYRKSILQAYVDTENALTAINRDGEHEKRLADVVRASSQAYDIERERLKVGTIDITTVLTTQTTLFNAQDALAVARLTRFQAIASLAQALGGGWTDPRRGPVEPAVSLPKPFDHGLPGVAIVPPNEAVTETHALEGQPPVPGAGPLETPGLGSTAGLAPTGR